MDSHSATVITPSYNQGRFIERTIQSVLGQGINDLEYLVFDGGSTDSTLTILKKYKSFLSYVSKQDEGQADAVNKGLVQARGSIIGWLNSDDIYYENALREVLEVFHKHPEVDVVYGEADHIDEHDRFIDAYYTREWNYEFLKQLCFVCQPAVFFRKEIVHQFGVLDKKLKYCMDYEYWLRIGQNKSFYFLKKKLAGSRLYSQNKTIGSRQAVHEEIVEMLKNKFGSAPPKWIYNLAHVLTEQEGLTRQTAEDNVLFVKRLVYHAEKSFLKYEKQIPPREMERMRGWLAH